MQKINITDIIESIGNSQHCFKTLKELNTNQCSLRSNKYYSDNCSVIFDLTYDGSPCILRVFTTDCGAALNSAMHTIRKVVDYKNELFSGTIFLPSEITISRINGQTTELNVAVYEGISGESLFALSAKAWQQMAPKQAAGLTTEIAAAFKWLAASNVVVGGLGGGMVVSSDGKIIIDSFKIKVVGAEDNSLTNFRRVLSARLLLLYSSILGIELGSFLAEALLSIDTYTPSTISAELLDSLADYAGQVSDNSSIDLKELTLSVLNPNLKVIYSAIDVLAYINASFFVSRVEIKPTLRPQKDMVQCFTTEYEVCEERAEGRIAIRHIATNLWGFCNYKNEKIVNCIYDSVTDFDEGYAVAYHKGKAGIIDHFGNTLIPFKYDELVWDSYTNTIIAGYNGLYKLLSRDGKTLTRNSYASISSFNLDRALVVSATNGKKGYIDPSGKVVIPLIFDTAEPFFDNCAMVKRSENRYLITVDGKPLLD